MPPTTGKTLNVANSSFALERLAADCEPLQFLRELTQNSLEALGESRGVVRWEADTWSVEGRATAARKLSVHDTGCGMTGAEMVSRIGQLFSSGQRQALDGNFGIGAKISALPRNPHGLLYLSWRDGTGAKVLLRRQGEEWVIHDWGEGTLYDHIGFDEAPPAIAHAGHGTLVTLLGAADDEDTVVKPEGSRLAATTWLPKYLNSRYFRIPAGAKVTAPRENAAAQRSVTGQQSALDRLAQHRGTVNLGWNGVRAHWWILAENASKKDGSYWNLGGHVGFVLNDEIYETTAPGNSSYSRLRSCGVSFGYQRVVIYFEAPAALHGRLLADTSRSRLRLDHQEVPWPELEEAFAAQLPADLKTFAEQSAPQRSSLDLKEALDKRLAPVLLALGLQRYRKDPNGDERADTSGTLGGGNPGTRSETQPSGGTPGTKGGAGGSSDHPGGGPGGEAARKVGHLTYPEVTWLREADGTRPDDELSDRGASWDRRANRILVNGDFRGITGLEAHWAERLEGIAGAEELIRTTLETEIDLALIEAVLSVQLLQTNKAMWKGEDRDAALSDEALTLVVMQRRGLNEAIAAAVKRLERKR